MFLLLALLACGDTTSSDTESVSDTEASTEGVCISGEYWTGGNRGSPYMNPGMSCIGCHNSGEGPDFGVAGTLYNELDEPDLCDGVEGVTVEITDADGTVLELDSNQAGNFYTRTEPVMPINVRLLSGGTEIAAMSQSVSTGDCASCHTAEGANGAPGRVVVD